MPERPISSAVKFIDGIAFRPYRAGAKIEWRSTDNRITAHSNARMTFYFAAVDGQQIEGKFKTLENAMSAGVRARDGKEKEG